MNDPLDRPDARHRLACADDPRVGLDEDPEQLGVRVDADRLDRGDLQRAPASCSSTVSSAGTPFGKTRIFRCCLGALDQLVEAAVHDVGELDLVADQRRDVDRALVQEPHRLDEVAVVRVRERRVDLLLAEQEREHRDLERVCVDAKQDCSPAAPGELDRLARGERVAGGLDRRVEADALRSGHRSLATASAGETAASAPSRRASSRRLLVALDGDDRLSRPRSAPPARAGGRSSRRRLPRRSSRGRCPRAGPRERPRRAAPRARRPRAGDGRA